MESRRRASFVCMTVAIGLLVTACGGGDATPEDARKPVETAKVEPPRPTPPDPKPEPPSQPDVESLPPAAPAVPLPAPTPPTPAPPTPTPPTPTPEPAPPPPTPPPPSPPPAPTPPEPAPAPPPPTPRTDPPPETPAPPAQAPPADALVRPAAGWTDAFVGSDACKTCHFAQHRAWKKTALARSLDALAATPPSDAARYETKTRAGLDPARVYSTDPTCLPCHTTGYGATAGYPESPAATGHVGCEACHGPGGRYVAHKKEAAQRDSAAKFTREELTALGLVIPDANGCARCHNARNPTNPGEPFDFASERLKVHPKK